MSELRGDFGDVTAEYRAGRAGTGFVSGVSVLLWGVGPDAVSYLDGQVSQDLAAMTPGTVARALLLEPRGKLLAPMWVLRGEDRVGMIVDGAAAAPAVERLESFRFRVEVELERDDRTVHEIWGRDAVATAREAGLDPQDGWAEHEGHVVALLPAAPVGRVAVVGSADALIAAGALPMGRVAWDTLRIEAGEPVMGVDVDEATIPQESGLVEASVSFTKGCYVGQELVARIDSRGRVNWRLVGLVIGTNVVPPVGASVVHEGEERGLVTSVGESLTVRAPVAMAMVRREAEEGDVVELVWEGGGVAATVRRLPLDDFSEPSHTLRTRGDEGESDVTGGS